MGSNPATPTSSPTTAPVAGPAITARGDERVEEHRRDPEPDAGAARHRGAVRRAQAEPREGVPGDRQQVRVPGFRPGKVPAAVIDQRVGRGAVLNEAVQEAHPASILRRGAGARGASARPARGRDHRVRRRRGAEVHRRGGRPARDDRCPTYDRLDGHRRRRRGRRRARSTSRSRACASGSPRSRPSSGRSQDGDYVSDRPARPPSTARRCRAARRPTSRTRSAASSSAAGPGRGAGRRRRRRDARRSPPSWSAATSPAGTPTSR